MQPPVARKQLKSSWDDFSSKLSKPPGGNQYKGCLEGHRLIAWGACAGECVMELSSQQTHGTIDSLTQPSGLGPCSSSDPQPSVTGARTAALGCLLYELLSSAPTHVVQVWHVNGIILAVIKSGGGGVLQVDISPLGGTPHLTFKQCKDQADTCAVQRIMKQTQ